MQQFRGGGGVWQRKVSSDPNKTLEYKFTHTAKIGCTDLSEGKYLIILPKKIAFFLERSALGDFKTREIHLY